MEAETMQKANEVKKLYNERYDKIQKFMSDNIVKYEFSSQIVQFYVKKNKNSQETYENIAKFHLLNLCVQEIFKIDGGIFAIPEQDLRRDYLDSQVIKSSDCKSLPVSLELSEDDKKVYMEKKENFKEAQRQALICISVFMDIIEDDHKSALLTIAFEHQLNGFGKYLNVIKDAAKVISVHY